jgi:ATP-dependent Zn protease
MDGFIKNEKIVVIAATNNLSKVDPALLRSGRFDLLI